MWTRRVQVLLDLDSEAPTVAESSTPHLSKIVTEKAFFMADV
jgi:hypothetical protein